jgi:hypothetical protein
MKKLLFALAVLLIAACSEIPKDSTQKLRLTIQQCTGNTYVIDINIPKRSYLKINNYRVGVPELNVYDSRTGHELYKPITLNVCAFTVDTLN